MPRFVKLLRDFIRRSGGVGAEPAGMVRVLRGILPPEDLNQLIEATPDRRCLFAGAGQRFGLSEAALVQKLAELSGLEVREHLPPFDPGMLTSNITLEMLRCRGATVAAAGGVIEAIVCIDPSLIGGIMPLLPGAPVAVARWSVVAEHLEGGETAAAEHRARLEQEHQERLEQVAEVVFGLIVDEASKRGESTLTLTLDETNPTYSVRLEAALTARGTLHPMLVPPLARIVQRGDVRVPLPNGFEQRLTIRSNESERAAVVTWLGRAPFENPADPQIVGEAPSGAASIAVCSDAPSGPLGVGAAPTIFVIDDNATFVGVLRRFLERRSFVVRCFSSAEDAWGELERGADLDLIICDVHMPGMTGPEFVRRLRSSPEGRGIPVVMLTSDDDIEIELSLLSTGADAFVSKGADPRRLSAQVERLLERHGERRAA